MSTIGHQSSVRRSQAFGEIFIGYQQKAQARVGNYQPFSGTVGNSHHECSFKGPAGPLVQNWPQKPALHHVQTGTSVPLKTAPAPRQLRSVDMVALFWRTPEKQTTRACRACSGWSLIPRHPRGLEKSKDWSSSREVRIRVPTFFCSII